MAQFWLTSGGFSQVFMLLAPPFKAGRLSTTLLPTRNFLTDNQLFPQSSVLSSMNWQLEGEAAAFFQIFGPNFTVMSLD